MIDPSVKMWRSNDVCRIVNKYNSEYDVNIQRGTIWGNPYTSEEHGENAIPLFNEYFIKLIKDKIITKNHLEVLRGMRLGCTCKPKKCHGDMIVKIVNKVFKDDFRIENL